jgi:hypothetical protein
MLVCIHRLHLAFSMQQLLNKALPLALALALGLASAAALADSTSSAASSASTSLGSASTSLGKSSDSASSKARVAQGNYTLIEMAALDGQPDMLRLRLVAASPAPGQTPAQEQTRGATGEFFLVLPREAAQRGQLATGQTVAVQHRPYGLALFAANTPGQASPFFLVLDDPWHRELASRPVGA